VAAAADVGEEKNVASAVRVLSEKTDDQDVGQTKALASAEVGGALRSTGMITWSSESDDDTAAVSVNGDDQPAYAVAMSATPARTVCVNPAAAAMGRIHTPLNQSRNGRFMGRSQANTATNGLDTRIGTSPINISAKKDLMENEMIEDNDQVEGGRVMVALYPSTSTG
jgi:hypothetical protein